MSPLRRRLIEDMQIRNLAPSTQRAYVAQLVHFACYFRKSPDLLGPAEIRAYLIYLAQEKCLAASSIIVTVSALRFFYTVTLRRPWVIEQDIPTVRRGKKLPVVLSQDEVAGFLAAVDNLKHRMVLTVCYATGLRISEAVRLTPAAIDSKRMVIRVEQGKGGKDRYVMLSPKLLDMLGNYWDRTRAGEWLFPGRWPGEPIAQNTKCRRRMPQDPMSSGAARHLRASRWGSKGRIRYRGPAMIDVYSRTNELDAQMLDVVVDRLEYRAMQPIFLKILVEYLGHIGPRALKDVLDMGCGTGFVARHLGRRQDFQGRVLGVNLSPHLVEAVTRLSREAASASVSATHAR